MREHIDRTASSMCFRHKVAFFQHVQKALCTQSSLRQVDAPTRAYVDTMCSIHRVATTRKLRGLQMRVIRHLYRPAGRIAANNMRAALEIANSHKVVM